MKQRDMLTYSAMEIADILIGLLMLRRWMRGWPVFTDQDWLFLTGGRPREKVFSLHLWLRFAALWFAVVLIGFVEGYVLLPFGLAFFVGAVFLAALVFWRVLRRSGCGEQ